MTVDEIVTAQVANIAVSEPLMSLAISQVEQEIKNYCNIDKVPEELKFTWASMAVDFLRYQYAATATTASDDNSTFDANEISSIKIGDTSIGIGSGSTTDAKNIALKSHQPHLDSLVLNYKEQLNRFRRLVW